jgi:hypothetical protein
LEKIPDATRMEGIEGRSEAVLLVWPNSLPGEGSV